MSGGAMAGEAGWQDDERACASLPDKRLERRLRRLLDQLSSAPGQPVPAACGDWAATKAAYRFFDNPRVTEHGVLAGHFAATAARIAVFVKGVVRCRSAGGSDFVVAGVALGVEADVADRRPVADLT